MKEVNIMEMTVNVKDCREFVEDSKFSQFLLNNTTDFSVAAWVLSTLLNELDRYEVDSN